MTRPATASSMESSRLSFELLVDLVLLDHRLGRRCPL
jgi:hypothetical protein